jgi:hypothetical protein
MTESAAVYGFVLRHEGYGEPKEVSPDINLVVLCGFGLEASAFLDRPMIRDYEDSDEE